MKKIAYIALALWMIVLLLTGCELPLLDSMASPDGETVEVVPMPLPEGSFLQVHYIDVGQADAALVLCDGEAMLIDGGNREDSGLMYSYLKAYGITELQYVVCTHGHEDHCGGLAGALNYAKAEKVYCPVTWFDSTVFQNFVTQVKKQGLSLTVPKAGETFLLGNAICTIIGPIRDSEEPNNTSIVLRIDYGETSFVFTGDAEWEEEIDILDAQYDVKCTVLKVAHHGSDSSTGYRWLRESMPEYAVISVGKGNDYGHPTENTLSRLRDADVAVYRTDMQGTIVCTSDGKGVSFEVSKNPDADTLGDVGNQANSSENDVHHSTENGAQGGSEPQTYILNLNSKKFHLETCSAASEISEKNKEQRMTTRDELLDEGFSACGWCKP